MRQSLHAPPVRRPFAPALFGMLGCTALTYLAVFAIGWLLALVSGVYLDLLDDIDPSETVTVADAAGFATLAATIFAGVQLVVGAVLLVLLRLGDAFASLHPLVQGLAACAASASAALVVLLLL